MGGGGGVGTLRWCRSYLALHVFVVSVSGVSGYRACLALNTLVVSFWYRTVLHTEELQWYHSYLLTHVDLFSWYRFCLG